MLLKKIVLITSSIIVTTLLISCQNSTESKIIEPPLPYMSLKVGDIFQIINHNEGVYLQQEVADTARRSDGTKVFLIKIATLLSDGIYRGQFYAFIKGNYYTQTNLDTLSGPKENRYEECKLANIYPNDGDYFLRNEDIADSGKIFTTVQLIDSLATPCGTFKDVAKHTRHDPDLTYSLLMHYARGYGYIGSTAIVGNTCHNLFITYTKINGKEFGKFIPLSSGIGISQLKKGNASEAIIRSNVIDQIICRRKNN